MASTLLGTLAMRDFGTGAEDSMDEEVPLCCRDTHNVSHSTDNVQHSASVDPVSSGVFREVFPKYMLLEQKLTDSRW